MTIINWHHRWNILALTLLSQAITIGIHTYTFAFWVVPWIEEFRVSRSELILTITISIFIIGAISPLIGYALDRYPIRILFCAGAVTYAAALFLISMATSHWMIIVLYGTLLPIGTVLCGQLGSQRLITRWFKAKIGLALGASALGLSAGAVSAPLVATTLLAAYGWREAFQILAAATFILLVPISWIVLRQTPQPENIESIPGAKTSTANLTRWTNRLLVHNRDFWIIALGFAALLTAYFPVLHNLGSYAKDLAIPQERAALVASLGAMVLAVGKILYGKLSDVVEHRRLYWTVAVIAAFGISLISLANSFPLLLVGFMFMTFALGSYLPLLSNMIVYRFGTSDFGQVMGLASFIIQLSAIAPLLAALMRDVSGSYRVAFVVMTIPLIPAMFAMRSLSSRR